MATILENPQVRLSNLIAAIDGLEEAFATEFSQWDKLNLSTPAHLFQVSYAKVIRILQLVTEEEWKQDADPELKPDLRDIFKRGVNLLSKSFEYVKKADVSLDSIHKLLLSDVRRLCERRDITGRNGLGVHVIRMFNRLYDIWPPAREAWTAGGSDLKPDAEFDRIFDEFYDLDNQSRKMQGDYESYARISWDLLQDACRALHIPESQTSPGDDFFHNNTRPTYVDYPCNSKEFVYGKGDRPGILSVKSRLGAPLNIDQQKNIKNATKKRGATLLPQVSKKARTEWGYGMTQANAVADIEDSLRDIQVLSLGDIHTARPDAEKLVTPTCENRKEILILYKDDLYHIIEDIYTQKFKMPLNEAMFPLTPDKRDVWIQLAENEIVAARGLINFNNGAASSAAETKKLRLAAYRLKLSRALYMLGLLSGESVASPAEIKNALLERLDDWILYEQAWNAGDHYILARVHLSKETFDIVQQHIKARDINIVRWGEMKGELEKSPPPDYYARSDIEESRRRSDVSPILTEEQIKTAKILLDNVLSPKLPSSSDYVLDVREERRRRDWFQKKALARLTGDPMPKWTHKKVVDPFTAGGPPDWQTLPRKTRWERLKYMWVMTFWRLYQLKELEL
ncbi:hypothetical protein E0Z10_g6020 [Xylaria hypoxylon]|uniref:Uncharacterized protein n=1 Tax=Xylaria hypoxylon TaxID=37992 RepID=A0A4Z0YWC6_9PEZI|nr:hypothetical protein E0Z10_g6020 [Xylaria hypoxylon]